MRDENEDDVEGMKDNFLNSLIKNMDDGMVDQVKKSKSSGEDNTKPAFEITVTGSNPVTGSQTDDEEDEEEDKIGKYMMGGRSYGNSL